MGLSSGSSTLGLGIAMAYIVKADIEAIFGVENVKKWADLDGDNIQSKIDARVVVAITAAEDDCNSSLESGPYIIPFAVAPTIIKTICAMLAGVWLYNVRGTDDVDGNGNPVNKMRIHLNAAHMMIGEILAGKRVLAVAFKCKASPTVRVQTFVDGERSTVTSV